MVKPLGISSLIFSLILSLVPSGPPIEAASSDYLGVATAITPFDVEYRRVYTYLLSIEAEYRQPCPGQTELRETLRVLRRCLKLAARFRDLPDGTDDKSHRVGRSFVSPRGERRSPDYWQLPEETEARRAGDCEDKAIWLYAILIQEGFTNIRLVVGKYRIDQSDYHAWVAAYLGEAVYILDPTINNGIWEVDRYPEGFYKPMYSYYKGKRWQHL